MNKEKRFKEDLQYRACRILHLANKYGWTLTGHDEEKCQFKNKENCTLHINYVYLKVATALDHPKWGNTILERKGELTQKMIEAIFRNPRTHMPKNREIKSSYIQNP